MAAVDAVLLLAFGGPERVDDVRPFLAEVLRGRPVPAARVEEVVHHYALIGGRSPLNALTARQAEGLAALLRTESPALPVYVGMRAWHPFIADTLARMRDDGIRHALALILAPHRAEASWQRYIGAVEAGRAALGATAPAVTWTGRWFDHPGFVEAMASRVQDAVAALGVGAAVDVPLVCTAHSIPTAMAAASAYVAELETTARLVATAAGVATWSLAYQSRSGGPDEAWLEPDVNDVLRALAAGGSAAAVVAPIGFVCDHVEVLYDLDVEAAATAHAAGLRMVRAGTVNDHPAFLRMLADVVRAGVRTG